MSQMPLKDPTLQGLPQQFAALQKEIADLRRQVSPEGYRKPEEDQAIFSHPGAPMLNTHSPPWTYHRPRGYLTRVVVAVGDAGADDSMFLIQRRTNGNLQTLATLVLAAGDEYTVDDDLMAEVEDLDRIVVQSAVLGSGLLDVTITVSFMESVE